MGKNAWVWDAFYTRFPSASALVELSAAAIDLKNGNAVVYCSSSTGALAGHGFMVMLEHRSGGWVPMFWQMLWEA